LPHALTGDLSRLVLVYGESARSPEGVPHEFSYFVAYAMGSGEVFQCVVRPRTGLPPADHLRYMGLSTADFDDAVDQTELCQRWQSFLAGCAAPPLMAAWNQRTLDLLTRMTGSAASRLSLKGAYRAVYGRDALSLEEAVEQRALVLPALGLMGRAERRLGGCVAVAHHLNARASTDEVPA
jgi:hypothetical protein